MVKEIDTPHLVKIIEKSKKGNNKKIHSATKVFQALRIFVNKEISELIYGMIHAAKVLKKAFTMIKNLAKKALTVW